MIKVTISRPFGNSHVEFVGEAKDATEALSLAHALAGAGEPVQAAPPKKQTDEKQTDEKEPETKKSDAVTDKTAPAKSAASGEPSASTAALSYDQVKEAILAIAAKNREQATALLQRFGAKTGKDLKEEQWPEFHADAQRVIAGEYDPTAGE